MMNWEHPRGAASRRSREGSPVVVDKDETQDEARNESREGEAAQEELAPGRSTRQRGEDPTQLQTAAFMLDFQKSTASSDIPPHNKEFGESHHEGTSDANKTNGPSNIHDQAQESANTRDGGSKDEEKPEPANGEPQVQLSKPQGPIASPPELEADKSTEPATITNESISTSLASAAEKEHRVGSASTSSLSGPSSSPDHLSFVKAPAGQESESLFAMALKDGSDADDKTTKTQASDSIHMVSQASSQVDISGDNGNDHEEPPAASASPLHINGDKAISSLPAHHPLQLPSRDEESGCQVKESEQRKTEVNTASEKQITAPNTVLDQVKNNPSFLPTNEPVLHPRTAAFIGTLPRENVECSTPQQNDRGEGNGSAEETGRNMASTSAGTQNGDKAPPTDALGKGNSVEAPITALSTDQERHRLIDLGSQRGHAETISNISGSHELSDKDSVPKSGSLATSREAATSALIPAAPVQNSEPDHDTKRAPQHVPLDPTVSEAVSSNFPDVEDVKMRLYDIACKVHRGKGAGRRFSAYWEALSRFVGFRLQRGGRSTSQSTLDGVRRVLDSFLVTKQMRRLHNLLIMGLMEQCGKDYVIDNGIRNHVPRVWQKRAHTKRVTTRPVSKDAVRATTCDSEAPSEIDLSDYNLLSEVWTASGQAPLYSHSYNDTVELANDELASSHETTQLPRHSPCLPGALAVDPFVRGTIRDEGLKVSEPAVWLLVVAIREYVRTLLKDTISNCESVATGHSLPAMEFSKCAVQSGKMAKTKTSKSKGGKQSKSDDKEGAMKPKQALGKRKRCISAMDIAATLNSTRLSREGSLGGSAQSLAFERCCHTSFNGSLASLPPELTSLQSFIVDQIEAVSKRPKHEWRDPEPPSDAVIPDAIPVVATPEKDAEADKRTIRSPSGGMGKEAKNLAAMMARTAAAASATETTETTAAPAPSSALPAESTDTKVADGDSMNKPGDNGATKPVAEDSPPSIPPRGRGRGFGVKNLAAMRARSVSGTPTSDRSRVSTPAPVMTPPPPQPVGEKKPEDTNAAVQTVIATKEIGKELRRLQEVQLRNTVPGLEESSQSMAQDNTNPPGNEAKLVHEVPVRVPGKAESTQ